MSNNSYKVLILGAGSGGISVAAKLRHHLKDGDIAIVDPSEFHYYQPLWTIAGAGLINRTETRKNQADLIPKGVNWIKESVEKIDPEKQIVTISHGLSIKYDYLVVATGLQLDWGKISGLDGHLGKNGLCSVYEYNQVEATGKMIQEFQGGDALFVMPPTPIKCAGAPQKIMYLAENIFRNNGVRKKTNIKFVTAGKAMFGIPIFSHALEKIVIEKSIEPLFQYKLLAVSADKKEATFSVADSEGKISEKVLPYDLLHIVPTMSAHKFISESDLAAKEGEQKGWLAVDKFTLQHIKYSNVFGVGDVTGVPNSKTGAAVRSQYPVVAKNLLSVMNGKKANEKYNGYSSCPLITEIGKVMLAEFGYDGKLMPTFPLDPAVPRRSMWILKKYLLPKLYWYGMLKGRA
jgi:sulfide:quinone oxidoreductase